MKKEKISKKYNGSNILITTLAVATAVICIALTFWGNWKNNGVLTTDAFIGVMATFIGASATLVVGVQIASHIEIRNLQKSMKNIEDERKSLNLEKEAFAVEMYNTRLSIGNALALLAFSAQKNNDLSTEFNCWVHSIIIDDWSSLKGSTLLNRYKRLVELSKAIIPVSNKNVLEDTLNRLSILDVPKEIEHYDEIMSLHYKLLTDIKNNIHSTSNNDDNK